MQILLNNGAKIAGVVKEHKAAGVILEIKLEGAVTSQLFPYKEHKLLKAEWFEIDWKNMNAHISESFTVGENLRYDPARIPVSNDVKQNIKQITDELQLLRDAWGSGIKITSGYRPPAVNKRVGGVRSSTHLLGSAVDIAPVNGKGLEFERWLDLRWNKALGFGQRAGKSFTHIDLRPGKIRWNY